MVKGEPFVADVTNLSKFDVVEAYTYEHMASMVPALLKNLIKFMSENKEEMKRLSKESKKAKKAKKDKK